MRLSIVVPVYNVENYLAACLDSLIYPDIPYYEIIVVNDGSTDNSLQIAESYAGRYPELIRIISQENGGLGAARNTGIENARGEYIIFVDSDDTLAPNAVREMYGRMDEGFDILVFGMRSVNSAGEEVNKIPSCKKEGVFNLSSYPELLLSAHSACNKIFRLSLFKDTGIRFPGRVWYEDMRTVPKLYLHAEKICTYVREWYIYLQRPGSITNNADIEKNLQIIDAANDLIGYYKAQGAFDKYREELEYIAFYNEFLTASVRACLADAHSAVLNKLREAFVSAFPSYADNPYVRAMPKKHKLLAFLLMRDMPYAARLIMKFNNAVKKKNA